MKRRIRRNRPIFYSPYKHFFSNLLPFVVLILIVVAVIAAVVALVKFCRPALLTIIAIAMFVMFISAIACYCYNKKEISGMLFMATLILFVMGYILTNL